MQTAASPTTALRSAVLDLKAERGVGVRKLEAALGLKTWSLRGLTDRNKPQSPSIDNADAICRALGIQITLGPARPRLQSENGPPISKISSGATAIRKGLDPVSDRRLAEILGAICAHFESLDSDYARQHFIADLWAAGGSGLRAQGSGLTRVVAWLGWEVIEGNRRDGPDD